MTSRFCRVATCFTHVNTAEFVVGVQCSRRVFCLFTACIDTWLARSVVCPMCKVDVRSQPADAQRSSSDENSGEADAGTSSAPSQPNQRVVVPVAADANTSQHVQVSSSPTTISTVRVGVSQDIVDGVPVTTLQLPGPANAV
jgi:hypothetical protein